MTVVAKLVEDAETLYVPTGKLLMRYSPRSLAFCCVFYARLDIYPLRPTRQVQRHPSYPGLYRLSRRL